MIKHPAQNSMDEGSIHNDETPATAIALPDALPTKLAYRNSDADLLKIHSDDAELEQPEADRTNATSKQADQHPPHVSSTMLEGLPAEIRIRLLSTMPDLQTLARLIHASPVYYAQFRLDRKPLLSQILLTELGDDVFVDVYAAFKSRRSQIGSRKKPNTNISEFLASYRQWRSSASHKPTPDLCSIDDLRWMTRFYTATVKPLTSQFLAWSFANFDSVPARSTHQSSEAAESLTRSEKKRLLRAFYRFEVFCHLFGGNQGAGFTGMTVVRIFFSDMDFEPWEIEEMCCIYTFVKEKFDETINDVRWDLDENNPRFAGIALPELRGLAFTFPEEDDDYLNGTIGHGGLRMTLKIVKTEDHDQRVGLMAKSLRPSGSDFFEDAMEFPAQQVRRDSPHFSERDLAEQRREAMPFSGDNPSAPPLAWVLLWGGRYSNLFGGYVPHELRRWGHVMWDKDRLDVDAARKYLEDLWTSSPTLKLVSHRWEWMRQVPEELKQLRIDI